MLVEEAHALGFDVVGVARPDAAQRLPERLREWLAAGRHGDMDWIETTQARRADPLVLWDAVRSIVMVGMNYGPAADPRAQTRLRDRGAISVYAQNRDYHDVVKGKLKLLAGALARACGDRSGIDVKVFVDTAPVMEKPHAMAAGLGWSGKHTNLVSRDFGSWLFLGALFTTAELPADAPSGDHCGACRACLDACPTQAFPAPYQLDARRCVSYLTIEHKGPVPRALRKKIGNRIYGCDDCLAACPWNKFAQVAREAKLQARDDRVAPPLRELVALDDAGFRTRFAGGPIKRIGHAKFLRNVLIAIGNSDDRELLAAVLARLDDDRALVRGAAVWALARLAPEAFARESWRAALETDGDVREEWRAGGCAE